VVRAQAEAGRATRLTRELEELVDQELSMYDIQQVESQEPVKLAPAIQLYNITKVVNHFDFETTLSKYKYHRGVVLDVKNKNQSYSRVTGIVGIEKVASDVPEKDQELKRILNNAVNDLVQNYAKMYEINDLNPLHDWLLMQYLKGDYFKVHKDDLPDVVRTVSVVVYLNDAYEGGEIEFPDFGVLFKPSVWDVLIFPSSFAYRHEVHPISDGVRYSAVNWYTHSNQKR
jgi:predicted 2-oxoglutarate/Fe(II)-dependent dioxygenase YbiX